MAVGEFEAALSELAALDRLEQFSAIAEGILAQNAVNQVRSDERFAQGISRATALLRQSSDEEFLRGIAALFRMGSASKPVMTMVRHATRGQLESPIPPLDRLKDGESRYYAALSLEDLNAPWIAPYCARGIANEETAEKARAGLSRTLLRLLPLDQALELIAVELGKLKFETDEPIESATRRMKRVVAALRPALVSGSVTAGESIGKAIQSFLLSGFTSGVPAAGRALNEFAAESCGFVFDLARTQVATIADPKIYRALGPIRNWMTPPHWSRFVKKTAPAQGLLAILVSAIVLLGRQNVADGELLEALQIFAANRKEAEAISANIATEHPELPADIREWISKFGRTRSTPVLTSMSEARDAGSDFELAGILVGAASLRGSSPDGEGRGVLRLLEAIDSLATKRGMRVKHQIGDVIPYSPVAHELVGGHRLGIARVKVVAPLVERTAADGSALTVLRAVVEPIGDLA